MKHFIVRGLALKDNSILLAYFPKKGYYFLPGGHIETGESSKQALKREIMEEIGCNAEVGDHLTTLEHSYKGDTEIENELTLIYKLSIAELKDSKVEHLTFQWVPIKNIVSLRFLPEVLKPLIINYANGSPIPPFISTM